MSKQPTAKKRNPQDATLRNVRAAKKREELLDTQIAIHHTRISRIESLLDALVDALGDRWRM